MTVSIDILQNWLQGAYVILILYHLTSYYFSNDKSFFVYAIYVSVLFSLSIKNTNNPLFESISNKNPHFLKEIVGINQCAFVISYLWFTYYFLDFKKYNRKLARITIRFNNITTIASLFVFSIDLAFSKDQLLENFNLFLLFPCALIIVGYLTIQISKIKSNLSTFYLVGLYILIVFSILSIYFFIKGPSEIMVKNNINFSHVFMIGTFSEVVIVSVGLALKDLLYLKRNEKDNYKLLAHLKENEKLQDNLNKDLKEKVAVKKLEIQKKLEEAEAYKLTQTKERFKNEVEKLKLSSLLNQMNPHFIFNALNSIKLFIINNEAKQAVYYLNKFSKLIRKILDSSTHKTSSLREELEILEIYVNLEKIRFSNEIDYSVSQSTNIDLDKIYIPSLVLQPFIENAIWHGLSTKKGEKKISLYLSFESKNVLLIKIKDNGIGREKAQENKGKRYVKRKSIGLQITKERLLNFSKNKLEKFSLTYTDLKKDNKPTGTEVLLKIPLR